MRSDSHDAWVTLRPPDAARILAAFEAPWWVAGGWAIDLFVGRPTRSHGDLDVGVFRGDAPKLRAALAGWDLQGAQDGRLEPWSLDAWPGNQIWCRPSPEEAWQIEVMLNDHDGDEWLFRRDHRVRRPLAELAIVGAGGIPALAPEVQLLFKAKDPRSRDDADLAAALPHMSGERRAWLRWALGTVHPATRGWPVH